MKKHMKKLTAAVMALAMLLSLAVTASAGEVTSWSSGNETSSTNNPVENQGGLPEEVIKVVMPTTAATGTFKMIFDAQGLIATTDAARYADENGSGYDVDFEEGSNFFFRNVAEYEAIPKVEALTAAIPASGTALVASGTVAEWYTKVETAKIYATLDNDGKFTKWQYESNSAAADVSTAAAPYSEIASITTSLDGKDFSLGATKDLIADFNKANPHVQLKKAAANTAAVDALKSLDEYTFNAYSTTATDYRYVVDDEGTAKVYDASGLDSTNTTVTLLGTNGYKPIVKEVKQNFVSYKTTSNEVKIINKGSKTISVSMSAQLSGIAEPDYTYAATVDSNGKLKDASGTEITGPAIYLKLFDDETTPKTSVMTYDTDKSKGTAKISTTLASGATNGTSWFHTEWDSTNNKYVSKVDDTKATDEFPSITFQLQGAINQDDGWDSLANATMDVTWKVKEYKVLTTPPTLSGSWPAAGKPWTVTVSNNKDLLNIDKVVAYAQANAQGTATELTATKSQAAATGAVSFTVIAKNLPTTKPGSIVVTFVDQKDSDLTIDATMNVE